MKILALDTSSIVATVAIMDGEKLMAEYTLNHRKTHSQKLMPILDELLKTCQLRPRDIDVFGVSLGPGSFTGLRIGLATIKAMAQALDKPVVGVSTLEGLAYNLAYSKDRICPIIDGQRDLVYTGLYQWDRDGLKGICQDKVIPIRDLLEKLKADGEAIIFVGDAVDKFREEIEEKMGSLAIFPPSMFAIARASSIAQLTRIRALQGKLSGVHDILPIYMRKSQAEKQWEERMKNRG